MFTGGFAKGMKNPVCFVAGTMVLTASGLVAIETIKAGDKVIATNPDTNQTEEKTVVETYINQTECIVHLHIKNEVIKTTKNHPFYMKEKGSKDINDLLDGLKETTNDKGIAKNFESSGGYKQTFKDFEELNPANVKDIQKKYGPGKVGTLSNGTKVVARPGSNTGGATLEITVSNSKVYKIRY